MVRAEKQLPLGHSWRKSVQRRLRGFCCSCLPVDELESLQEDDANGDPPRDREGSGAVQIIVEDLGTVNCGFSLLEEDHLTPRSGAARSASSLSISPRPLRKKQPQPLPPLPVQPQANVGAATTAGETGEEEREEAMAIETSADHAGASGSLQERPALNLIPPTPAAVAGEDRFFEGNLEGGVEPAAEGSKSSGGKAQNVAERGSTEENTLAEPQTGVGMGAEPGGKRNVPFAKERDNRTNKEEDQEKAKPGLMRSSGQVVSLHQQPLKNRLSDGDVRFPDVPGADLCLFPRAADMDSSHQLQRLISRSLSEGETLTSSATSLPSSRTPDHREEKDTQQKRRSTLASYVPPSEGQHGNVSEKDMDRQQSKSLGKLNTDEVCQWFTRIGLQKCLPFIREAKLCGADMAAVSLDLLRTLRISTVEDRERLLSAVYSELHPPTQLTQRLDALLESPHPRDVETFAAALASMNKSKSSPHVSCLSMSRRSLKLRSKSQTYMVPRNSHLIEITINVSEQIVHLRTPKDTTVGKVMDSCIKMLGVTEDKSLFIMTETQGSSETLPLDRLIGSLARSDNKQLELHLCKREKPAGAVSHTDPEGKCSGQNSSNAAKEERIRELNQQVDSLQRAIRQIQELHHDLVAFCSELKSADADAAADGLDSAQLGQRLELAKSRLSDKKQKVQTLRDHVDGAATHKKQLDVHLLEKMRLNCQVFKEEISVVHLNRQVAHLQSALRETHAKEKVQRKDSAIGSLSQLVSPESPAMLLAVRESCDPDGRYGFTCHRGEGGGLVVADAARSRLCVGDRLVEVNGVPVVGAALADLEDILLRGTSAQIVVLRQPSHQRPPLQASDREAVSIETTPQRDVVAI